MMLANKIREHFILFWGGRKLELSSFKKPMDNSTEGKHIIYRSVPSIRIMNNLYPYRCYVVYIGVRDDGRNSQSIQLEQYAVIISL